MNQRIIINSLAMVMAGACSLFNTSAVAQAYPSKPIRIIVPASPAGGLDIMARVVGQPLSSQLGQPVVVENRPGAGVMLGTEMASKAFPDGYTLLMINANLAPNAILQNKISVVKNLAAVVKIADLPNALSVPASLPVSSMQELVAMAKSSRLTYSSAGNGTVGNILTEMLKLAIGADITHVPYKGGNPAMNALMGGQVSMGVVSLASTMAHVKAGRVKILAVSGSLRSRLAPEIPTISETVKGVALESWVGLLVPRGVPPEVIRKINSSVIQAVALADTQQRLISQGYDVMAGSPEAFDKLIQNDMVLYGKVIRQANIKAD